MGSSVTSHLGVDQIVMIKPERRLEPPVEMRELDGWSLTSLTKHTRSPEGLSLSCRPWWIEYDKLLVFLMREREPRISSVLLQYHMSTTCLEVILGDTLRKRSDVLKNLFVVIPESCFWIGVGGV